MQAQLDDISVHYEVTGQGPLLTLSHSLATTLDMWEAQLAQLNQHFTLLRYDTRGHGGSTATPGPYTMDQLADDAAALLRHLGIQRTHWLGLSMGGTIGQVMALRHPALIECVVLADTTAQVPPAAAVMWAERAATARQAGMHALVDGTLSRWFTEPFRLAQPVLMARIGDMISNTSVEAYAGCCAALANTDNLAALRQATQPVLVIVGAQDQATPVASAQAIVNHWPGAQLITLSDAAHLSNIEQAPAFNAAVVAFLTESSVR